MEKRDEDDSGPDAVAGLLKLLGEGEGTPIPTSLLGRLRRTATTAARAGAGALVGRLSGLGGPQERLTEQLVLSLGELKGVAMKAGQVLSYVDASLPIEIRRQLEVLQTRSQPTPFAQIERILRGISVNEPTLSLRGCRTSCGGSSRDCSRRPSRTADRQSREFQNRMHWAPSWPRWRIRMLARCSSSEAVGGSSP